MKLLASIPPCLVGMESGSGAHYWARQLAQLGHSVRLMPPQFVRPYVKTNKNDAADAEACCEAVQRPGMRFVPVKSVDQQTAMALHRVRDHLVRQRTGTINALRGHLAEFGIVAAAQRTGLNQLVAIVEDDGAGGELPFAMRAILQMLIEEVRAADERIAQLDRKLKDAAKEDEACRRLIEVPGIGPVIATAVVANVQDDSRLHVGSTLRRLAGSDAETALERWERALAWDQQTRRRVYAATIYQWSSCARAHSRRTSRRYLGLDHRSSCQTFLQRRDSCGREQVGAHCVVDSSPQDPVAAGLRRRCDELRLRGRT